MNRFQDALDIQQGACNPRGVSLALNRAINEACDTGGHSKANDPAVRLILHQLVFIITGADLHLDGVRGFEDYDGDCKACESALESAEVR